MGRTLPTVQGDTLVDGAGSAPLVVGSEAWYAWLECAVAFAFVDAAGTLTARKQRPNQKYKTAYWYAFRKSRGRLYKAYLGRSADLSRACLAGAAAALAERARNAEPPPTLLASALRDAAVRATSLAVPPVRPNLVARARLYALLDAGLHTPLTLVVAPAGYGKTTLLTGWLATLTPEDNLIAWASLDAADHNLASFLAIVIAALQAHIPAVGATTLALLGSVYQSRPELLLTTLLADFKALGKRCVLVLDDYHLVRNPVVHQALAWLLERMPPNVHIFLATREAPPLPLARLRVADQLTEISTPDLRFTAGEAAQFLNTTMNLALAEGEMSALETRTEGWVGGLQLAALALRNPTERAQVLAGFTGSHRFVADYFADQVLAHLQPHVASFVLQTSILERLSAPLCDFLLTNNAPAQATLQALERANLFLLPLDEQREWFRYHPLFASMARERLRHEASQVAIAALHLRASEWWEQHDAPEEAIAHALAGHYFERAANLIGNQQLGPMLHAAPGLERWLAALPPALWQSRPRLWLARAVVLFATSDYAALGPCLQQAEAVLRTIGAPNDAPEWHDIAAMHALTRSIVDDPAAIALLRQTIARLGAHHPLRGTLAAGLVYATFGYGDLPGAREAATEALALLPPGPQSLADRIGLLGLLALVNWGQGRLHEAEHHCHEVLRLARGNAQIAPLLGSGIVLLLQGVLAAERDNLLEASRSLAACVELARQAQMTAMAITAQAYLALTLQAQGDNAAAHTCLAEAERHMHELPPNSRKEFQGCRVLFWLRSGEQASAFSWASSFVEETDPAAPFTAYDYTRIALARTFIVQGQAARAEQVLARLVADAEATGHGRFVIWALILQAVLWQSQGNTPRALHALERALTLAMPEGYIRLFADEGAPMALLLHEAQARGIHSRYVAQLLAACPPLPPQTGASLAEPLTPRELEVLRQIAAGASNQAIAQHMVVSLGTVKKYANSMFGKLNVQSRTQAIVRGRDLGLL